MVAVPIVERAVWVRPWLYVLQCPTGGAVPILLLDTDISENDPDDRGITSGLYGGDAAMRLKQEIVLGIAGEMLLRALGFEIATYHLNEGHAALLPLALLRHYPQAAASPEGTFPYDLQPVRERFKTHTQVDAGHDRFDYDLVGLLGDLSIPRRCGVSAATMR
jgi:starch phosphorylase